jgi:hypothetical protein
MSFRTVERSSFEEYMASDADSAEDREDQAAFRDKMLARFPYSVVLKVSFPELDFADRWCWQEFGPRDGECPRSPCEYPVCKRTDPHFHTGKWTSNWITKTDYDFGFNEWYFAEPADRDAFVANVDNINWGENFPKKPRGS